jgi:subtilisin family serine protease
VLTTTPGAGYAFLTGNSLAAAHATGVIALLLEREPTIAAQQIATLLTTTTTYALGSASINACRALARLTDTPLCGQHSELPAF